MMRTRGPQIAILVVAAVSSTSGWARSSSVRPPDPDALESMPFNQRCELATLLGREMRDLLSWIDPRRVPGVLGDDGFHLLVTPATADEIRSVFKPGERCAFSLDRVYPTAGKIRVTVAEDPPERLPEGRSYALLFERQIGREPRWEFGWSLNAIGYAGCTKEDSRDATHVDDCRHPGFMHGLPTADVRIVVVKKGARFEAEVANLEVAKWSSSKVPSD